MAVTGSAKAPDRDQRRVSVLGSTGSVGQNTIELISKGQNPGQGFVVEALTAHTNVALLAEQAKALSPNFVAIGDETLRDDLTDALAGTGITIGAGETALSEAAARPADWVMAAIVGAAGLNPTLAAIRQGATVALANKEVLVCAGDLVMQEVSAAGGALLPVDSEHNAIFQVFDFDHPDTVEKIILTASGGPFRDFDLAQMASVTPAQAVAHPNWDMGAKISIDSATMMNKGLELIEAHHLFRMAEEKIDILLHPQSVVHSLVSYVDGSVLAQLGAPDMRTPISVTLAWPDRLEFGAQTLDLAAIGTLTFEPPDQGRFPALGLARQALQTGGTAPTILNAANEVAVVEFMAGRIGFLDIARVVEETLTQIPVAALRSLDDVFETDTSARRVAKMVSGS
ncbi:MAG: 1-deoxy-D-xylulose-5-phosphate reductoisomerase [Alphaproteobacteria bacterium]|jgi:1-deoxy-D-xylulose-5-phosphate reductoisomerase|nr:1-deoxy-D-xylulose-5-phosphate reductoisomerase [Alphaproteobacteria bacterium]MBT4711594.1 1-deoxy-D-xylulose-5-phosphate reductoisomerase [Alphaproteobacteria bacterium]MBT5860352.1 1-deoxy-D-xylulose-5-phosphate reductoisomerase [Alphaproteobacteria bacterium]